METADLFTEMTLLTKEAYEMAQNENLSIRDAVRFLEGEMQMRSLRSKIEKFAKGKDETELRETLVQGLLTDHPEMKRDSVERRVRGWLSPKNTHSLHKEDAIEAAFILGLNLKEADDLAAMISEERLHYRSAKEIVYIYALRKGLSFNEASALCGRMQDVLKGAADSRQLSEDLLTANVRPLVEGLETEEELRAFLQQQIHMIGYYHNQAYEMFTGMLEQLKEPESSMDALDLPDEKKEKMTIRNILREYLYAENVLPARRNTRGTAKKKGKANTPDLPEDTRFILSMIQKEIADGWPDEIALSRMKTRKKDVNRKTLILLFLATESVTEFYGSDTSLDDTIGNSADRSGSFGYGGSGYNDPENGDPGEGVERPFPDWEEMTREEIFAELQSHMKYMLSLCGYAPLDPRNPFDWIILYAMCAGDLLDMDSRMRDIFMTMYRPQTEFA